MLRLVTGPAEIKTGQGELKQYLFAQLPKCRTLKIGHLGRAWSELVANDGDLWYATRMSPEDRHTRYWNAFGLLRSTHPDDIIVEINFPLQGVDRRIAGVLARDSKTNEVFVLHRGGIGGGRPGIGKHAFLKAAAALPQRKLVEVEERVHATASCIPVGRLNDESLVQGIYSLVRDVLAFKQEVAGR
jgi:5-methylcytosine-specific restriction protein A